MGFEGDTEDSFVLENAKLSDMSRPFIFLVTHFEHLQKLSQKYMNVASLRLNEQKSVTYGNTQPHIPLKLARFVKFPNSVLRRAENLLNDPTMFNQTKSFEVHDDGMSFNASASLEAAGFNGSAREVYDVAAILFKAFRSERPEDKDNLEQVKESLTERLKTFLQENNLSGEAAPDDPFEDESMNF